MYSSLDEWGEFLHLPGKKFYDFSELRAEIARETDRVTGIKIQTTMICVLIINIYTHCSYLLSINSLSLILIIHIIVIYDREKQRHIQQIDQFKDILSLRIKLNFSRLTGHY